MSVRQRDRDSSQAPQFPTGIQGGCPVPCRHGHAAASRPGTSPGFNKFASLRKARARSLGGTCIQTALRSTMSKASPESRQTVIDPSDRRIGMKAFRRFAHGRRRLHRHNLLTLGCQQGRIAPGSGSDVQDGGRDGRKQVDKPLVNGFRRKPFVSSLQTHGMLVAPAMHRLSSRRLYVTESDL